MPDKTYEGTKVVFATAVANIAAPTQAEINAGTDLSSRVVVDGLASSPRQNMASQAMLGDSFVAERVGTHGLGLVLRFKRNLGGADAAWDLFSYRTVGFLIIGRNGSTAAAQSVEVIPVESHRPIMLASAENEFQKFEVPFAVTADPNLKAVAAA